MKLGLSSGDRCGKMGALLDVIEALGTLSDIHGHMIDGKIGEALTAIDTAIGMLHRAASALRAVQGQLPS